MLGRLEGWWLRLPWPCAWEPRPAFSRRVPAGGRNELRWGVPRSDHEGVGGCVLAGGPAAEKRGKEVRCSFVIGQGEDREGEFVARDRTVLFSRLRPAQA